MDNRGPGATRGASVYRLSQAARGRRRAGQMQNPRAVNCAGRRHAGSARNVACPASWSPPGGDCGQGCCGRRPGPARAPFDRMLIVPVAGPRFDHRPSIRPRSPCASITRSRGWTPPRSPGGAAGVPPGAALRPPGSIGETLCCQQVKGGAEGQNRTGDTMIFSHVLYRLSYLGTRSAGVGGQRSFKIT